jgi:hypothetical protein
MTGVVVAAGLSKLMATKSKRKDCVTCVNWRENPEQCYDCARNPGVTDRWRPVGSAGFHRDGGKPVNPIMPRKRK